MASDLTDEVRPRVWVGPTTVDALHWCWDHGEGWVGYCDSGAAIDSGDIFMICPDEPTIDSAEMKTIATCGKVDWK